MNDKIHLLIARVRTETSGIAVVDDLCAEAESLAAKFKANVANLEFALIQRDEARGERDEAVKLAGELFKFSESAWRGCFDCSVGVHGIDIAAWKVRWEALRD
jgi:hypothetical protein